MLRKKKVTAEYYGGHGCVDKSLYLYNDSTYYFETTTALLFAHTSRTKGRYTIADSAITLYAKKRFHFLLFKQENKYRSNSFRLRGNEILLYPEAAERSKDNDFIKAYNTMRLVTSRNGV